MNDKQSLLNHLENETQVLKDPLVKQAFVAVDRADFVSEDYKPEAYEDYALPIGYDQTISQPTTVAFMLELLNIKSGERVMDIGSGSGFTTALIASIVGSEGSVFALEKIPELVKIGKDNLSKYGFKNVFVKQAGKKLGMPSTDLFDRILVSAESEEIPDDLIHQLKIGGIMVIPVNGSIVQVIRTSEDEIDVKEYPGFAFVPLKM